MKLSMKNTGMYITAAIKLSLIVYLLASSNLTLFAQLVVIPLLLLEGLAMAAICKEKADEKQFKAREPAANNVVKHARVYHYDAPRRSA
jgi:hypothetical protein